MKREDRLSGSHDRFAAMAGEVPRERLGVSTAATRDHTEIARWATAHKAEPATGEATPSGPAGRDVNDRGAGIRFNFPGFGPFRPISWEEWFAHFDSHDLVFVYEQLDADQVARLAYARWEARGGQPGSARDDWFYAERELHGGAAAGAPTLRYRIVKNNGAIT